MASSNPFEVRGTITVIDSATVLCVRRRRCADGDDEGHAALLTPEDVGGADSPFFQVRATSHGTLDHHACTAWPIGHTSSVTGHTHAVLLCMFLHTC